MVTTFLMSEAMVRERPRLGSARRSWLVAWRNVTALRSAYWLVVVSGFVEPLLYLLSIGVGVGALTNGVSLPDGRVVDYAVFVAPATLAASAMTGATVESTFHFFSKMKHMRLYDAMLITPLRPMELAFGELVWSVGRGALYCAEFLALLVVLGLVTPAQALWALPAAALVSAAFGGLGMVVTTYVRAWRDFDLVTTAQLAMFVFSGTFAPVSTYPPILRLIIEVTPLFQGVELLRDITTSQVNAGTLVHAGYLLVLTVSATVATGRRLGGLVYT